MYGGDVMQIKQTVCDFCLCRQNGDGSLVDAVEAANWIFTVGKQTKKKRKVFGALQTSGRLEGFLNTQTLYANRLSRQEEAEEQEEEPRPAAQLAQQRPFA